MKRAVWSVAFRGQVQHLRLARPGEAVALRLPSDALLEGSDALCGYFPFPGGPGWRSAATQRWPRRCAACKRLANGAMRLEQGGA